MKKLLLIIAVLMVIPTAMTAQTAKTRQWKGAPYKLSTTTAKGDVNGDGDVNVTDVSLLVGHILGNENSNFIIENADVNGDGYITVTDVTKLVSNILEGNGDGGIGDTSQAYLTCPDDNHPHMIDLGLPSGTLWACCNVGATTPEGFGGYYAWGETEEKDMYNHVTYLYSSGVDEDGDGYYDDWDPNTGIFGYWLDIGDDIAGTQNDVAHVKWGGFWVMPSIDQIDELLINCSYTWTTKNGVQGGLFTGPNGGIIFLPAARDHWSCDFGPMGIFYYDVDYGDYWLSTQSGFDSSCGLSFYSDDVYRYKSGYKFCGRSVRPVSR